MYYMENGVNFDMVTDEMSDYYGEEVTIDKVKYGGYRIKEDGGTWLWTDQMIEKVIVVVE